MDQESNSFEADRKRFWLWTAGSIVVLAALAATVWFCRPHYRHFKERREQQQAQAFLARGDFRNALLSARQTLQLDPTNVPACRVMAALADRSHNPVVLDLLRRIVQTEPTVENKLQLASAALRYQSPPFPLTAQILEELAPAATNLASYQVAAANVAFSLRRLGEAETHFETAAKLDPTNQLYAMNLAIIRLGATNATKAVPSRAVLENLRMDANLGPPALRALVVDRLMHKDVAAANVYSTQLLASAKATLADQLQQLGILRQLHREDFSARLQAVQQQAVTNAATVAETAAWMQANDLLADDLRWLTNLPAKLQSQQPVRLALADAYMQSADWHALRDFVSAGDWDEMNFLRLALLSRAWSQLGVPPVAESNWGSAVNQAGNRYGALTTLLGLAERWKLPREREDLLRRIVEKFPRERWAQHSLEPLYLAEGNTAGLNQLYTKLFSIFPQDVRVKNNLAYTCLLLNTNLPQACRWAEEVYAGKTNDAVAATFAFALLLQGRTKDGLAVMQKLDARFLQQPDTALYYAILLTATGDTNQAAPFFKIARTKTQWLPEEKVLLSAAAGG
jgi:tetratricopeptide (TPR) repeat protein